MIVRRRIMKSHCESDVIVSDRNIQVSSLFSTSMNLKFLAKSTSVYCADFAKGFRTKALEQRL
jgi:hypothetical protein